MTAPKDRAAAPTRSLFLLSGVDALLFLVADVANLGPLLILDGPVPFALAWTATLLAAATGFGFAGAFLAGRRAGRGPLVATGLANGTAIAVVAAYFAIPFRIFGVLGFVFFFLVLPGFAAAWMGSKISRPSAAGPFTRI